MTLQSALITALRFHARDLAKTRHRAAGRKLTAIPATQLSRDADAPIPKLIEQAVMIIKTYAQTTAR
jgi:hypothetical protein